ncbi:aspartate--tRNA ligase [Patescibacteria group bacterium]|nr:aspartate--tRNA ligase [Patescibacteria group bacterium]MBU1029467.1 aspartate--tRNA ligase [Patescibacteria group bacterium]MBU1916196.1 aspartate--tRNA ligase [Patescibacteria group bacterium]
MKKIYIAETGKKIGEKVTAAGWVHARRDMGKIIFIDLRDSTGLLQVVFAPNNKDLLTQANALRPEFCVQIKGQINERPEKMRNPNMITGGVEMLAEELEILNESKTPPFELDKDTMSVGEELRLKYRYLDLRSERLHRNLLLRDRVVGFFREWLRGEGFIEVETPTLTKGTPEGAREFIVPSRIHSGKFYVLPQSPQQFKQLLMVAGVERYFQIARCYRDEDQRGDRQPEFTQLDLEMSFVEQEDILELNERMMIDMVKTITPDKRITTLPFPRIPYAEAIEKYGSDKPDLRQDKNDPNELAFCWIVDFPLFEKGDNGTLQAAHHPFCRPNPEDMELLDTDPLKVRGWTYDLVLNGYELSSGSIRIHQRELQDKIFRMLGLEEETINSRFGHLLEAFEYGAPPHGGMAPGIDRLVMLLAGEPNIREIIPFPKTGDARCPLMGAPSDLPPSRLKEANIAKDV